MEKINITEKLEEFYRHLSAADVDRTIFSAKFGDGKTEFLHQFKEKYSDEYTFYTLYPVNYQIAPNEQIMEYIKRDLLFQLILNGAFTSIDKISGSILLQWYVNENLFDIAKDIIKFTPSILGSENQFAAVLKGVTALVKGIKEQCEEFDEFKAEIAEGDFEKATKIIEKLSKEVGNIYELDPISWLIAQGIANKGGKSVLIIEDLDRIDPAHLFRILNIFSAHIDRHYLCSDKTIFQDDEEEPFDKLSNKFGFAKIIFVMDAESTEAAFMNFYGNSNYEGYINKFFSKRIFHYSITEYAIDLLYFTMRKKGFRGIIIDKMLKKIRFNIDKKRSVRDIARAIDNFEDAYIRKKVKVTDDFYFFSDTPLVKILALFVRMGVDRNDQLAFFQTIKPDKALINLLGCFAIDEKAIRRKGRIYYNGIAYQMSFNKDQDGYIDVESISEFNNEFYDEENYFLEINIDKILERALHYVN